MIVEIIDEQNCFNFIGIFFIFFSSRNKVNRGEKTFIMHLSRYSQTHAYRNLLLVANAIRTILFITAEKRNQTASEINHRLSTIG